MSKDITKILSDRANDMLSSFSKTSESFHDFRKEALASFVKESLPSKKNEQYLKIDVSQIFESKLNISEIDISEHLYTKKQGDIIVEDVFSFAINNKEIFEKYFDIIISKGAIEQSIGADFKNRESLKSSIVLLNASFFSTGKVIYVPKNYISKETINIDLDFEGAVLGCRDLIIIEDGAEAKIFIKNLNKHAFLNRVCEVYVGRESSLEMINYNFGGSSSNVIFNNLSISQKRNSKFKNISINISNAIIRDNIKVSMAETGCNAELFGSNISYNSGLSSTMTVVEHNAPHCNSYEHYKNIVKESGVVDFNGHIFVNKDAQKTSAFQRNNNIVLDNSSKAFTKPQLEIYADDVKCSHGATVGQLNSDALFYLRQRGISQKEATKLLLTGFVNEIIMKIDDDYVREFITKDIENILLK